MSTFAEIAAQVQRLYDAGLTHQAIAAKLTADGIAPALGAAAWSWQLVDKTLVLLASQRRARGHDLSS